MEYLNYKENPIYLFWKLLWAFSVSTGILAVIISFFSMNTGLTGAGPAMVYALTVFGAAVVLPIYTLPAFFAYRNRMKKARVLLLCNLLLGWTVIGYIVCIAKIRPAD
ncbi:MAG: superinfection immunity protein [Clostridia bacterium]|nr:superinfection immunity protein [Clostridia bacterium]